MIRRRRKDGYQPLHVGQIDQSIVASPNSRQVIYNYNAPDPSMLAVNHLRRAVRKRCESERVILRLAAPQPMPVQWTLTQRDIADLPHVVFGPDKPATFDVRSNQPKDLATQFLALDRRRLVIIGDGGAGKSVLAEILQWQLLGKTSGTDAVPVLLSLSNWDIGRHQTLDEWLIHRLKLDFPNVWDTHAPKLINQLIDEHRILPILDGFDEVEPKVARRIWDSLNDYLTGHDDLVLTCRTETYELIAKSKRLAAAAVIEAHPLKGPEIREYLYPHVRRRPEWDVVLATFLGDDSAPIVEVCSHPFGLWLFRSVYVDGEADPTPLLDAASYPNAGAIRSHLFSSLIPALVERRNQLWVGSEQHHKGDPKMPRRRWRANGVQRWLSYIAHQQGESPNIQWWQLHQPRDMSRWTLGFLLRLVIDRLKKSNARPVWKTYVLRGLTTTILVGAVTLFGLVRSLIVPGLLFAGAAGLVYWFRLRVQRVTEPGRIAKASLGFRQFLVHTFRSEYKGWFSIPESAALVGGITAAIVTLNIVKVDRLHSASDWMSTRLFEGIPTFFVVFFAVGTITTIIGGPIVIFLIAVKRWLMFNHDESVPNAKCPACIVQERNQERWRTPSSSYRDSRTRTIFVAVVTTLLLAIPAGIALGIWALHLGVPSGERIIPWRAAVVIMLCIVIAAVFISPLALIIAIFAEPAWFSFIFISKWLALRGKLPWHTITFLEDAHRLGLLRSSGAVYQFRHAELQGYLVESSKRGNQVVIK